MFSQKKTTYTYAIKGLDSLKLDVYTPRKIKKKERLPAILWMHAGSFSSGKRDSSDEVKLMKYVSRKGYIGISMSYRLLRKGTETGFGCDCPKADKLETFKQATIDYLDAAKFIFNHNHQLQIDLTKVIAGGSSAGAEGILNAVYLKPFFIDDLAKYTNIKFAGVLAFSGALVNAEYITKTNAIPTVLFHGSDDTAVPYGSAPHHYCSPESPGYLLLDGSHTISKKLDDLGVSYYFNKVLGGGHELHQIPFDQLDIILQFFEKTVFDSETIQTKRTIIKN
ncbi:hypothetical protein GCM10023311_20840 [Flaviramulus aquimarinus]|uniref:BD-FAE-like domain-containing protein n=2 Tax=Flaviramulus aquimarinus TaxID=1170456 RepID=A0ABP9F8W4_9FLAO